MLFPVSLEGVLTLARDFQKVLVTGPQRSGTTIAAHILAEELEYEYIDESVVGVADPGRMRDLLTDKDRIVVQCPGFSASVHHFATDDVLVVFMIRHPEDIAASERRVKWNGHERETRRYAEQFGKHRLLELFERVTAEGKLADLTYFFWVIEQRHLVPNHVELAYDDLSGHPLWIPKDDRDGWHERQWQPGCFTLPIVGARETDD